MGREEAGSLVGLACLDGEEGHFAQRVKVKHRKVAKNDELVRET